MSPEIDLSYEGVNVRCILLNLNESNVIGRSRSLFDKDLFNKKSLESSDGCFACITVQSRERPPINYRNRVKEVSADLWEYRVYLVDISFLNINGLLIASPIEKIIETLPFKKPSKYIGCNLIRVCNDQYKGSTDPNVNIGRLNVELLGEKDNKVTSLAMYGPDILSSLLMRDLLFQRLNPKSKNYKTIISSVINSNPFADPFSNQYQTRSVDPTSCRLRFDDGKSKSIGLNADRFGNFSFYLGQPDEINNIVNIFKYMNSIEALNPNIVINPLKRSKDAATE